MKITDILLESPLPDDWDKSQFNKKDNSFKSILEYCKERAKRLGQGSSRVAFEIEYEGRPTILKIAKNSKGILQNEKEVNILEDRYFSHLIPMIDYDTENPEPMWIHMEKAEKVTKQNCTKYVIDHNFFHFVSTINLHTRYKVYNNTAADNFAKYLKEEKNIIFEDHPQYEEILSLFDTVFGLVDSYDIIAGDFLQYNNWGIYDDDLVIIDLGFDKETLKLYYGNR